MIEGLRPYLQYRESGVPWLGEVPTGWSTRRARYLFKEIDERSAHGDEVHLSMSQKSGLVPSSAVEQRTLVSESYAGGKLCKPGDIVLNRLKAHLGVFALARQRGVISPDYTVLRPIVPMLPRYFEEVLRSVPCRKELYIRAKGIVEGFWRLYTDDFYDIRLPVPSIEEQAAIVRFLDHADRRIRRYIRAKQQLIKLLEEQKRAIIHRAVTRGLDPNVRLKPSGVEWLGDVPEHWQVLTLSRVTRSRCDGPFGSGLKSAHYVESGVRVVRLQNIGHGEFKSKEASFISDEHYASLGDHSVEPGDLIIAGLGDERHPAGRACIAPDELGRAMVKADCFRFRLDISQCYPDFVALHLTATAPIAFTMLSRGATRGRINLQTTGLRFIALPPMAEQRGVVAKIKERMLPTEAALSITYQQIAFLREYRTRLVSDVVTGKLDVRAAATALPDDPSEPDPLDDTLSDEADSPEDADTPSEPVDA